MLNKNICCNIVKKHYSKSYFNSKYVRQTFLDYFINENGHSFIRSSPVVPYCDSTLTFVNAGMNQFKSVFLDKRKAPATKVANSQKCIRVGGKHNDLDIVGTDGYHHTFFEMLGNWSFGSYFKKEACELAWNLLTGPYQLRKSNLYVTYFGGDNNLNLPSDLETLDIWKSIGVPKENILPFGVRDNFWEMGITGPCGPCTEIHYDHTNTTNRAVDVNQGLANLTELWNIVFIQFNRELNGSINKLGKQYVDTGMGLERLTAILNNKQSNYETDLFLPILSRIHQIKNNVPEYGGKYGVDDVNGLDTAYRIIADHARMITVCLADGIIPEENYRLRKVIRRAMILGDKYFQSEQFLWKICQCVIDILGEYYYEMENHQSQIKNILLYEEDVLKNVRLEKYPEWNEMILKNPDLEQFDQAEIPILVLGYREILKQGVNYINSDLAFKLYDTYGVDQDKMIELAKLFQITIDVDGFTTKMQRVREKSKIAQHFQTEIYCDDNDKYNYTYKNGNYIFENISAQLQAIIRNGMIIDEITGGECALVFNKTNFYHEAGGQQSDIGSIHFDNAIFKVKTVQKQQNVVLHIGEFLPNSNTIKKYCNAQLKFDWKHRFRNMCNHTATHILNTALRDCLASCTVCQKSSKVCADELRFDILCFGRKKITVDHLDVVEQRVQQVINAAIPVDVTIIDEAELQHKSDIVLVPGEVYPVDNIRLVKIVLDDFQSKEACCGTHLHNTAHMMDFTITQFKQSGRVSYSIRAITGDKVKQIKINGQQLEHEFEQLFNNTITNVNSTEELKIRLKSLTEQLNEMSRQNLLPYINQSKCKSFIKKISNLFKISEENNLREFIEMEMTTALKEVHHRRQPWLVHYLRSNSIIPSVPLQKATNVCSNHLPVMILAYYNGIVRARCCVPQDIVSDEFNAHKWMKSTVATIFDGKILETTSNRLLVCQMKDCKVDKEQWDTQLQLALDTANKYAQIYIKKQQIKAA